MAKPGKGHHIARLILAIPFLIITVLMVVAGVKLHRHVVAGVGLLFALLSLYCFYSFITVLCCGLMDMHKKNKCCHSAYVCCCMCFIEDNECCSSEENNKCPCFKWCCVDDTVNKGSAAIAELTSVITEAPDNGDAAKSPGSAAESSLLPGQAQAKHPPPIYTGSEPPKYEGW